MSERHPGHKAGLIMLFAAWGILLGLLTYFFHLWHTNRENPNQDIQGLVLEDGSAQVVLKSNVHHHYLASGKINGIDVIFLLDTGATSVVVPKAVAEKTGLAYGKPRIASTASGTSTVYMTDIAEIQIGNISLKQIKATISHDMPGNYVLLGMSALKLLNIKQQNNTMTLTLPGKD